MPKAEAKNSKKRMTERYQQLVAAISSSLYEADPAGLNFGDNPDEYDFEARAIAVRLDRCRSADDVRQVLFEEFVRSFGDDLAAPQSKYEEPAKAIWRLLQGRPE